MLPELVPKDELSQALALNGLGINISRVLGPALGGLVIGVAGVSATFLLNALTFFAVIFAYVKLAAARAQQSFAGQALHRRHPQRLALYPRGAGAQSPRWCMPGRSSCSPAPIGRCCR